MTRNSYQLDVAVQRSITCSAVLIASNLICALPTLAQDFEEGDGGVLPEIIVEGATLDAPRVRKKTTTTASANQSAEASAADGRDTDDGDNAAPAVVAADASQDTDGPETGLAAKKLGTAVSVVTGEELRSQQIRHAADALRSLPGVSVSGQGTPSNLTVVRIRGAESNHTLVLVDGVEVNSATTDGFFDFASLTTGEIAQIEVLRGPQSGLYGTGAIGGVVNIITKSGKGPFTVEARSEAGTFNTRGGSVSVSGGNDALHGAVSLQKRDTGGFNISTAGDEDDEGSLSAFAFRGGAQILDGVKIDATLRKSTNRGDRDGFGGVLNGFLVAADSESFFTTDLWLGRVQATIDPWDGLWVTKLNASGTETDIVDNDVSTFGTFQTRNIGRDRRTGAKSTLRIDGPPGVPVRHFITGLFDHQRETFEQPTSTDPKRKRDRDSYVGEIRGEYFDTLYLTGTVRQDENEAFEDFTTWRAAASLLVPGTPFRVHSSVGTGVKFPSLTEQFGNFFGFLPNPNLEPEESFGWDAGVETKFFGGQALLDVTYFESELTNEIDFRTIFVPPTTFLFQPFNRDGVSDRRGIEVSGRAVLTEGLTIGAAYTYLDAVDDLGREEVRRAPHSGRADVNWVFDEGRGNLNLAAIYNGEMLDTAFNPTNPALDRVALDEYWLVNVAASYDVLPGVAVYGRVQNLLDENYQEVFGFETADIAAYAGVKVTFGESAGASWPKGEAAP